MNNNTTFVMGWIERMTAKTTEAGIFDFSQSCYLDWGQALCREQYGANSDSWPEIPSDEDVKRAHLWEAGVYPKWSEPVTDTAPPVAGDGGEAGR
jgi:hypothetical protein